jgi:hypothetical protein
MKQERRQKKQTKKQTPSREDLKGKRIEWTGAGGDYLLGIVVSEHDEVIDERWGTREEVLAWMKMHWPQIPAKFVPMVRGSARRHPKSSAAKKKDARRPE